MSDTVRTATAQRAGARFKDLLRLAWALAKDRIRPASRSDAGAIVCHWARELQAREGGEGNGDIEIRIGRRRLSLIANPAHSRAILDASPARGAPAPGNLKRKAMSFLAPRALTIADGEDWAGLRAFHERVLSFDHTHPLAQPFLDHTRAAFSHPVADTGDIRTAMGWAMLAIVPGDHAPDASVANDVHALLKAVQNPLRRTLLGFRYRPMRERLYDYLRTRVAQPSPASPANLIDLARNADPPADRETFVQQIPHWMFTFTGSGTDLLARTMAMITARKDVYRHLVQELREAGPPNEAATIGRLHFARACLLETGRLYPPAAATFHRARDDSGELMHWFPLLHRDPTLGSDFDCFRPERWLADTPDAAAESSCLFLRGPRRCPGRDLILFVTTAALAKQLGEIRMKLRATRLSTDPLPVSFPSGAARFRLEAAP